MSPQEDNLTSAFKAVNMIYFALGAGMLVSLSMFYFMVQSGSVATSTELSSVFRIVVPVLGIGGFAAGKFLYGTFAAKSKAETNEEQKLAHYRTASLISWALLEGPGLFAGIAYFLTGDQLFLAFFAMIFLGFIFSKPSIAKFQQDF